MTIVYVAEKGSPLTIAEFDGNFEDLDDRVTAIEADPPAPVEIDEFVIEGNTLTVLMTDASEKGPYQLPTTSLAPSVVAEVEDATKILSLADRQKYLRFTHVDGCVVTVPTYASVAIPVDSEVEFYLPEDSAGVWLKPSPGVTINGKVGKGLSVEVAGCRMRLKKVASNEWDLESNDLATALTVPAAYTFTDVTSAVVSTQYTSNPIIVEDINHGAALTITGGEYSINGGAWATAATTVYRDDSVRVRRTSSGSAATAVTVVLDIGGTTDTYTITTA